MLSRDVLSWATTASSGERADAAHALARAYLYTELDAIERGEMDRAMVGLLDDPSPVVRRALAEALAGAAHAPHHVVSALACDAGDIAAVVLGRSPCLTDAELVDAVAVGDASAQCAVAARAVLSVAVSGALAEVGGLEAVLVLCRNSGAELADLSVRRILERFGRDGFVREAIGARGDIGAALRHELVVETADALRRFVTDCRWMAPERARRVVAEASDRATLALARRDAERDGEPALQRFAAHLRAAGRITPALLLRALMSGQTDLVAALLAELSGQPPDRVAASLRHRDGLGFTAIYRRTGLPDGLLPTFRAALQAAVPDGSEPALRRGLVVHVLKSCGIDLGSPVAGLTAMLRRFEAEAARDEGRSRAAPPTQGLRRLAAAA